MQQKPPCKDFIIAAARRIRMKPANGTPGTASGVALYRLYRVAVGAYTPEEFHAGLEAAIRDETILVIATVNETDEQRDIIGNSHCQIVRTIPFESATKETYHRWYTDLDGNLCGDGRCLRWSILKIYVMADGLPLKVQKLPVATQRLRQEKPNLAWQIIADMNGQSGER